MSPQMMLDIVNSTLKPESYMNCHNIATGCEAMGFQDLGLGVWDLGLSKFGLLMGLV